MSQLTLDSALIRRQRAAIQRTKDPVCWDTRFAEFHRKNPHVAVFLLAEARRWLDEGVTYIPVRVLADTARMKSSIPTTGKQYKINNGYTSRYARLLIEMEPRLDGVIRLRELKS